MTPMLVLGFGVQPLAAVSSDLVASVVLKPIGGGIHWRAGTVHLQLVRWLAIGSVPGALGGAYLVSHVGGDIDDTLQTILGVVLLVAAGAMALRTWLARHHTGTLEGSAAHRVPVRIVPTAARRHRRRARGRCDVGRLRLADDRRDDAAVPDALDARARRDRPRAGDPARGRGRARSRAVGRPPARRHGITAARRDPRRRARRARVVASERLGDPAHPHRGAHRDGSASSSTRRWRCSPRSASAPRIVLVPLIWRSIRGASQKANTTL